MTRLWDDEIPSTGQGRPVIRIALFRCCRDWWCSVFDPIGRCGICGEKPIRKGD